jgi:FdhD protein
MRATVQRTVVHFERGQAGVAQAERHLLREAPLVMRVNRQADYTVMRTPGHDRELTLGFLFTEGLIGGLADVHLLAECPDSADVIDVTLAAPAAPTVARATAVNSSCGLCGRTDLDALIASLKPVASALRVDLNVLYEVPDRVGKAQETFRATGASHAAALFGPRGELVVVREDVGRHNALDKVIGQSLMAARPLGEYSVFLSGRASLEMMVKAARAGIPLVAAVSAPTDAAVEAAQRLGITLCGFVRGDEVTVYAHEERISVPNRFTSGR